LPVPSSGPVQFHSQVGEVAADLRAHAFTVCSDAGGEGDGVQLFGALAELGDALPIRLGHARRAGDAADGQVAQQLFGAALLLAGAVAVGLRAQLRMQVQADIALVEHGAGELVLREHGTPGRWPPGCTGAAPAGPLKFPP